jgi:hypothetical protein
MLPKSDPVFAKASARQDPVYPPPHDLVTNTENGVRDEISAASGFSPDDAPPIDAKDFHDHLMGIADQMPPAPDVQPENDLHPDPALLRHDLMMLKLRVERLEAWAKENWLITPP